jgi:methionyl aminopeptidase
MVPPGIASGPEVHDKKGIECMRASGRLAAQVLQYAGTLVKVRSFDLWSVNFPK